MDKVFYDADGKLYKAKEKKSPVDSEMNFPTNDILTVLDDKPITHIEMVGRINDLPFRQEAVLAKEA